jgi:hypothetical protein
MEYLDYQHGADADPHAVLASTLCMMSCTIQSGCRIYLRRIAENLDWLSAVHVFDKNFRTLCRRLAAHWDAEANRSDDALSSAVHESFDGYPNLQAMARVGKAH